MKPKQDVPKWLCSEETKSVSVVMPFWKSLRWEISANNKLKLLTHPEQCVLTEKNKKKKNILVQSYSYRAAIHILVKEEGDEPYALDGPDNRTTLNHNKIICVL